MSTTSTGSANPGRSVPHASTRPNAPPDAAGAGPAHGAVTGSDGRADLLSGIRSPADLRRMAPAELPRLAEEIRGFLIDKVSRTGGHLGPNLGAVELTIAAHRVFDSARDALLFDTGHQTYVHKILTGRSADFDTLRKEGGLSGYPSRAESGHDLIENSHASTALSYADGLAKAAALRGDTARRVVAVVGDGALTGGMAWEALNNIGAAPQRPLVIVLNDNGRSYSPTVGGIASHLAALRGGAGERPPSTVFEDLGLAYLGPVDGHDTAELESALRSAESLRRPVVVHCLTRKGKGYPPAEADESDHMHTVGVIDPATGRSAKSGGPTWTSVFAEEITAIGAEREDVVCVTGAMRLPAGLGPFAERFPDRIYDVGIAEQHAATSAAGLAFGGMHPVVAVYAAFLGRAFDQVLADVALHRLPVTFVLDRAGVTGPDGASHHGMWDGSLLPIVPGLRLAAPRDCARLRELLREAVATAEGPTALRYPKAAVGADIPAVRRIGECDLLRHEPDSRVLLVAPGPMAADCLAAAENLAAQRIPASVVDPRWTAPLSAELTALTAKYELVVAVEDTVATGALGTRLAQALSASGSPTRVVTSALPPRFLPHASRSQVLASVGLDPTGIAATVQNLLGDPADRR